MNSTQQRVKYDGMPQAGNMPENIQSIIQRGLDKLNINDIRGARSAVDQAIQSDQIPEGDMITAINYMKESEVRLNSLVQEQRAVEQQASRPSTNVRQSFSINQSVGDSPRSLAKSFSLTRAIDAVASGSGLQGAELEAFHEARSEFKGARGNILVPSWLRTELRNVYGNNSGQSGIDANVSGRQTLSAGDTRIAMHNVPMAEQLGAQRIDATGSSTLLVPYLGRTDATTADEGAAATSSSTFSELSLTPQRYTRKTSVSALAMATTGQQLDSILLNDFDRAHAAAHDKVVFAAIRDNATFTNSTASGSDMAATDISDLFNLMQDTMTATGISGYFDLLASPIGMNVLNTKVVTNTDQTLGQLFVSQTGRRIIPVVSMVDANLAASDVLSGNTSSDDIVGAGHIVAGDMGSALLASYGGISLMVDPYSLRDEHTINVHADSYISAGIVSDAFRILAVSDSAITPS